MAWRHVRRPSGVGEAGRGPSGSATGLWPIMIPRPAAARHAPRALVDLDDQVDQASNGGSPATTAAGAPGIVARGRHGQDPGRSPQRGTCSAATTATPGTALWGITPGPAASLGGWRAARYPARRCGAWPPPTRSPRRWAGQGRPRGRAVLAAASGDRRVPEAGRLADLGDRPASTGSRTVCHAPSNSRGARIPQSGSTAPGHLMRPPRL